MGERYLTQVGADDRMGGRCPGGARHLLLDESPYDEATPKRAPAARTPTRDDRGDRREPATRR